MEIMIKNVSSINSTRFKTYFAVDIMFSSLWMDSRRTVSFYFQTENRENPPLCIYFAASKGSNRGACSAFRKVQKLFEDGIFGSTVLETILQAVQKNTDIMQKYDEVGELVNEYVDSPADFMETKLKELEDKKQKDTETELLIKRIKEYLASPHRDEYAIEAFEDVFKIFKKL